jgi:hypothetical protein
MVSYGKSGQPMNFPWQIARKIDRLDLGTFAAVEFFYRNAIIYGLVRALDPKEPEEDENAEPVEFLISSIDVRIKDLQEYDTTAIMMGHTQLPEVKAFQQKTMMTWYELAEVIGRCHLCDQVLHQIAEAP